MPMFANDNMGLNLSTYINMPSIVATPAIASSGSSFIDKLNSGLGMGTSLLLTYYQGQEAVNSAKAKAAAANFVAVPTYDAQAPASLDKYAPYIGGAAALALIAMAIHYSSSGNTGARR